MILSFMIVSSTFSYANIGGGAGGAGCGYIQEESPCQTGPDNTVALICKKVTEGGENKCYATTCESQHTIRISCGGGGI